MPRMNLQESGGTRRRDPACEMRFQTLLQWTASISGSLSLLGSGYVLHDLRAKRRANDGVLSVGEHQSETKISHRHWFWSRISAGCF